MARVLIVDDDEMLRVLVRTVLSRVGFEVDEASDGVGALEHLRLDPDLVILDVLMPTVDGFEVLAELRRRSDVPVIMLTGLNEQSARIQGLDLGADDYLGKPFAAGELVARVRSVLRRYHPEIHGPIEVAGLTLDVDHRSVEINGSPIKLTRLEFDLLAYLVAHRGKVHDRQELLEQVWGSSAEWQRTTTVTEHIRRIRAKIGDGWIHTVGGAGYEFRPTVDA